jgi:hypothetical protein
MALEAEKSKIKVLEDLRLARPSSLLCMIVLLELHVVESREKEEALMSLPIMALIPFLRAPPS